MKPHAQVTIPNEFGLSLGDPDSVFTIPRYTAATGNQLQNQVLPTYIAREEAEID